MHQNHYTFILPVWNESARISRTINYYRTYGRIIVVDNFSTDDTVECAKMLGCEVVQVSNDGSIQTKEWTSKVFALSPTSYVALLSCSEYIPVVTLEKFEEVARTKSHNLVTNGLISYTCGANIQLWNQLFMQTERRTERFFNKNNLDYENIFIHSPYRTESGTDILILPYDNGYNIIHFRDSDVKSLTLKCFGYASVEAKQMVACGKRLSAFGLFKRIFGDLIRYIKLPRAAKGFIALRELWARVMMNITIYFLVREEVDSLGIEYSRNKSNELWTSLVTSKNK